MLQPLNRIEVMLRETYHQLAKGSSLDRISAFFGFERPQYIAEEYWRSALKSAVFSARGTPGPIFRFLEEVFGEWTDEISTYTATALSPTNMIFSEASCVHEGRYVRINGDLYRTGAIRSGFPGELGIIPIGNTMFKAARFTPGESLTLDFLPFDIDERDCRYTIKIDAGVFQIPGAYFRSDGEDRETDPFGMHLMDFFSDEFTERFANVTDGPHPIYLDAKEFGSLFFNSLNLILAAGIIEEVQLVEWCPGTSSIYGDIVHSQRFGTASPDRPAIVTPTRS